MSKNDLRNYLKKHIETTQLTIKANTIRAFFMSVTATLLLALAMINMPKKIESMTAPFDPEITITCVPIPPINDDEAPAVPSGISEPTTIVIEGTKQIAGKYVPVPDLKIGTEIDFAAIDKLPYSLSTVGNAESIKELFQKSPVDVDLNIGVKVNKAPSSEEVVSIFEVQKEPTVDLAQLQGLIEYPPMARKARIQGKVIVSVLINKTGKSQKCEIIHSDNSMLDEAAINAVLKASFTPAIQNGYPVNCKVTIPIVFKLK